MLFSHLWRRRRRGLPPHRRQTSLSSRIWISGQHADFFQQFRGLPGLPGIPIGNREVPENRNIVRIQFHGLFPERNSIRQIAFDCQNSSKSIRTRNQIFVPFPFERPFVTFLGRIFLMLQIFKDAAAIILQKRLRNIWKVAGFAKQKLVKRFLGVFPFVKGDNGADKMDITHFRGFRSKPIFDFPAQLQRFVIPSLAADFPNQSDFIGNEDGKIANAGLAGRIGICPQARPGYGFFNGRKTDYNEDRPQHAGDSATEPRLIRNHCQQLHATRCQTDGRQREIIVAVRSVSESQTIARRSKTEKGEKETKRKHGAFVPNQPGKSDDQKSEDGT